MESQDFEVIIIGAGVTGTALTYVLAKYTNVSRMLLLEKHAKPAQVNSSVKNNSQTLHMGDIETNYNPKKSAEVKQAASLLLHYVQKHKDDELFIKQQKMVLAVGEEEVKELEAHYEGIKEIFPELKELNAHEITECEPNVMRGRDIHEPVLALSTMGYTMNYERIAQSFVDESEKSKKDIVVKYNVKVKDIRKEEQGFTVEIEGTTFTAKTVVCAAGPHSLVFAKRMGVAKEFGVLPVAGNFYAAENILQGKVYRVQIKGIPFAAMHGDPDVMNQKETRFGPTIRVLPVLERHDYSTFPQFLKTSAWSFAGIVSLTKILSDKVVFRFVYRNLLFDVPFFGKRFALKEMRKIVPSLKARDIHLLKGAGGIRPQLVNTQKKSMEMGEAKFSMPGIIFNVTPSPGASVCLKNAETDTRTLMSFLGKEYSFDEEKFKKDLY